MGSAAQEDRPGDARPPFVLTLPSGVKQQFWLKEEMNPYSTW